MVQIAKAKGMTVIGSAGGADKCAWVRELGADAAIDYKAGPLVKQLQDAAPKGIDVYFDNVGGDHLDAAFATARQQARFAICGMIDGYNSGEAPAFRYIMRVISARIRMQGFIYTDYLSEMATFYQDMGAMIGAGKLSRARPSTTDRSYAPRSSPVRKGKYGQDSCQALVTPAPPPFCRSPADPRRTAHIPPPCCPALEAGSWGGRSPRPRRLQGDYGRARAGWRW